MKDKYSIYRFFTYGLQIFILLTLQQSPNILPKFMSRKPNLVLALFIVIIIFESSKASMWFGFFIGLALDASSGDIIGINAIMLSILGYGLSLLCENYFRKNIITLMLAAFVLLSVIYHLQFLIFYILKGYNCIKYVYLNHCLPGAIYTFLCVPIIYLINKIFTLKIKGDPDKE